MHRQGTHRRFQDFPALSPLLGAPDRSGFQKSSTPFPSGRAAWYNRRGTHRRFPDCSTKWTLLGGPD
eukprot:4437187-Amphidinium_carterae.1